MQRFTSRTLVVHDEGHACALKIKFFPQISGKKNFFRKKFFPRFQEKKIFSEKNFSQISGKKNFFRKKFFPDFRKKKFFQKKIFPQISGKNFFFRKNFFPRFQETQNLCSKSRQTKISSVQRSETLQRFCVYFEIHIIFFPEKLAKLL